MIAEFVEEVSGFFFSTVFLPYKGMAIPQHVHSVTHPTLCGSGRARLYIDGSASGDVEAGHVIVVEGGRRHVFEALEDNTRLTCVFATDKATLLKTDGG